MHMIREDQKSYQPAEEPGLEQFARSLDALRAEVEADLGKKDLDHITRIRRLSRYLEIAGRALIHVSFEPAAFSTGVLALSVHKSLELMEIGHMVLHGAYDALSEDTLLHAAQFRWKAPIDESSWRAEHNIRHHQYTNVIGRDPDLDFGPLRLSALIPYSAVHRLQPLTNVMTWFAFSIAINANATGMVDIYARPTQRKPQVLRDRQPSTMRAAQRNFLGKTARYYARELLLFPMLAGPFFWKVALGNMLSEVARDLCAGAIIYCGHVGTASYPEGAKAGSRARWYVMQIESTRDVELSLPLSILCGALDKQIEHHLFPRLPPNRLRDIAPRVKALCKKHGVRYQSASWPDALRAVTQSLRAMSRPVASA